MLQAARRNLPRQRFAGYRAGDVADVIDILHAGGAEVTDRHRELAATAGASQVEAALRR